MGRAGATPPQFRVWGSQGPALAKAPTDWTEVQAAGEGLPTLTPTEEEKGRGFVVFALDPVGPAQSRTAPSAAMRTELVRCFAARGQYEPLTFGVWSLEDLAHVTVRLGQLRSEDGAVIPADHVEVRVARPVREIVDAGARTWQWRPFLLERRVEFPIPVGTAAQVWLTVKVPEDAKAGVYAGTARLNAAGRPETSVKLTLRVLPFTLSRPPPSRWPFTRRRCRPMTPCLRRSWWTCASTDSTRWSRHWQPRSPAGTRCSVPTTLPPYGPIAAAE